MSLLIYYCVVACLAAFISLFRSCISLGIIERPLALGFVCGCMTGEFEASLAVALFFELAWLDIIPVGTFIPPHLTLATIAALSLGFIQGVTTPGEWLVIMIAAIPMAWVGSECENILRSQNSGAYKACQDWLASPFASSFPKKIIYLGLCRAFLFDFVCFLLCILLLHLLVSLLFSVSQVWLIQSSISWLCLWLIASLGGLLSLRVVPAYFVFWGSALLLMLIF